MGKRCCSSPTFTTSRWWESVWKNEKSWKIQVDPRSFQWSFATVFEGWSTCLAHVFAKNMTASIPLSSWIVPATNGTSWRNRVQTIWSTERGTTEKHSQEFHRNHFTSCLAIGGGDVVHRVFHLREEVIPTGVVLPSHSQHIPSKKGWVRGVWSCSPNLMFWNIKWVHTVPPKSNLQDPNPQNQNSKIQNQNSKIQNQNSKIQNQNSKIQNQNSRIQSRN